MATICKFEWRVVRRTDANGRPYLDVECLSKGRSGGKIIAYVVDRPTGLALADSLLNQPQAV